MRFISHHRPAIDRTNDKAADQKHDENEKEYFRESRRDASQSEKPEISCDHCKQEKDYGPAKHSVSLHLVTWPQRRNALRCSSTSGNSRGHIVLSCCGAKPPDFNALMEMVMAQLDTSVRGKKNGHARAALKARTNDVLDDFVELRKDMNRLADAANKAARDEVKHAGQRIGTFSNDLRSRATSFGTDLRGRANDGVEYASETVRSHPGAAVGISLGVGLIAGLLLSRR